MKYCQLCLILITNPVLVQMVFYVAIMKASIGNLAHLLSTLINSSITNGCFPDSLKLAKVCPIFKNGDKTDIQNYCPISVLTSFSKIFEKVMFNRILLYLESNKILNPSQYGFRKNHSTYMSLLDMHDRVTAAIIFLDN